MMSARKLDRKTCHLCVREAAALRRKQAKQVIAKLTTAQRQVLDDGAEPSARRAGAGVGISGRQSSAAKLVELGLAELAGGRLWLTGVAQEALGLPRLQSDEVMRRVERQRQ